MNCDWAMNDDVMNLSVDVSKIESVVVVIVEVVT